MTKKPRRFFTAEQKAEAVNIVNQLGKPVSQVGLVQKQPVLGNTRSTK